MFFVDDQKPRRHVFDRATHAMVLATRRDTRAWRQEVNSMDCCGHEGHEGGDARFDVKQVVDGVHVAVAAPAYKVRAA
jgi:hypothetical protein